jgi:hypothetical protein
MKIWSAAAWFMSLLLLGSCTTDFEVYAPEKEIRSVYCVLNPNDSVQYVRVAKAFQFRGDALQYAAANDLSVTGRVVKLSNGNKTWFATQETMPKDSGDFYPFHAVYKFVTDGSGVGKDTLREGQTYRLEIGAPEDDDYVTGETVVPSVPRIKGELNIISAAGSSKCLPTLALERKFNMFWQKAPEAGVFYEVRVRMEFERNGVPQPTIVWGPTELFNVNRRCNEGSGNICYQFAERELLRSFFRKMPVENGVSYTYNTANACVPNSTLLNLMPKSLCFEATAVDEKLSNYMQVNNPKFLDLTGTKPEYTNLGGKIDVVGIFGSYSTDRKYAVLNDCSEALLGLNGQVLPPACNWE